MSELKPRQKRQARIITLQAIYARELQGSDLDDTCNFMMDVKKPPSENVIKYGKQLSNLIFMHTEEIDKLIISRSKNWDFDRITLIDKLILRMALTEMVYVNDVPPKVSIAEGVEIAKQFSTEDSSGFINGILDSVYNEIIKGKEKTV
ncbi:transcription antitermination factor NusB [Candidatus Marinimicrobia bacterium PRS2]|nr:transcription antitermination factor NusB [Candidatus Marinimicrobia bacterium PRS2]